MALNWLTNLHSISGVPVKTEIFFGGIPKIVLEKSKLVKFLALGRWGHTHLTIPKGLGGNNFHHIASHTHIPILIGGAKKTNFRRLLIALDRNADTITIFSFASALQKAYSSEVRVAIYQKNEMHPEQVYMILS
jgi:hypothetical protein